MGFLLLGVCIAAKGSDRRQPDAFVAGRIDPNQTPQEDARAGCDASVC
jgi:hypothetical protein